MITRKIIPPRFSMLTVLISLAVAIWVAGRKGQPELNKYDGFAEGTTYHITWWSTASVNISAMEQDIQSALRAIDKEISSYRNDSYLQIFNHDATIDWRSLPASTIELLSIARPVYHASHGCYDPTIGPLFDLWGFRSGKTKIPTQQQIALVKKEVGFRYVKLDVARHRVRKTISRLSIDLSSEGEGYTIWRLSNILEQHHIHNYIVEFGGDLYVKGYKPGKQKWRIAIARPVPNKLVPQEIITINDGQGMSINTSGTYRRFFEVHGK